MLAKRYKDEEIESLVLSASEFQPFPKADDRKGWNDLPDDLRNRWIQIGEGYIDTLWPSLPATKFMEFEQMGNRSRFERIHFERRRKLSSLVLAECMEGKGRFLDDIINGIWAICEESFWGVPAHNIVSEYPGAPLPDIDEPIIDLFAAETSSLLSWIYYLLKSELDDITPIISKRIEKEIKRRILDPYLERDDFWWMGFQKSKKVNNWNPWCNSNCLVSFLIIERDIDRKVYAIQKALRSLDTFIEIHHPDGGCDEGSSYWGRAGASLFDCLELLYWGSDGKIDFFDEPLIGEIGRYIYRAHIHDDYFINFADGGAKVKISADLVYRYGKRIEDKRLIDLGIYAYNSQIRRKEDKRLKRSVPDSLLRILPELFNYRELVSMNVAPPYVRDIWLDGIEVMAAREAEGDYKGFYIAAKGGHNAESHNHNDVGQFIVYYDGVPVIIDVGVETYTKKTFSSQRYDIWTMQSKYHNLPTVNGVCQKPGQEYRARDIDYSSNDQLAKLSLDMAAAYPKEAGIEKWIREIVLCRGEHPYISVKDEFKLDHITDNIAISLMIPKSCEIDNEKGLIILDKVSSDIKIQFDSGNYICESERIDIEDERLKSVWGDGIYRLLFKAKEPMIEGKWELKLDPR
ncbi:MAG: heparinase [Clostridiales bacterium]|nr:heparinase [Clostridiales bacterium]